MGLDHYLIATKFLSPHSDRAAARKAREALASEMPDLDEWLDPDAYITLEVELIRWRKSYLIHGWWCEFADFSEERVYIEVNKIIEFDKWATEILMSGSAEVARKRAEELSGGWSDNEEFDEHFWNDLRRTVGTTSRIVKSLSKDESGDWGPLASCSLYYDASW